MGSVISPIFAFAKAKKFLQRYLFFPIRQNFPAKSLHEKTAAPLLTLKRPENKGAAPREKISREKFFWKGLP